MASAMAAESLPPKQRFGAAPSARMRAALSPEVAREWLRLQLSDTDSERVHELSSKANSGQLTSTEEEELENYLNVGWTLEFIKAKARLSPRGRNPGQALQWTKRFTRPSASGPVIAASTVVSRKRLLNCVSARPRHRPATRWSRRAGKPGSRMLLLQPLQRA